MRPLGFAGGGTCNFEGEIRPVQNWNGCMVLKGKESVRHRDKHSTADPDEFRDEEALVFETADVLEHRIRSDDVERTIGKRQRSIGDDSTIVDLGKGSSESMSIPETDSSQVPLHRIASFDDVCGVSHNVGGAYIQDFIETIWAANANEIFIDTVAGQLCGCLGQRSGLGNLVVLAVDQIHRAVPVRRYQSLRDQAATQIDLEALLRSMVTTVTCPKLVLKRSALSKRR